MSKIGIIFFCVIILISCKKGVYVKTTGEVIELKDFKVLEGRHCESTSIMNALNYQGIRFSEATINGIAGSPGFVYVKDKNFPFLGTRVFDFIGNFIDNSGLEIVNKYPGDAQAAYDEVKNILKQRIPVVLQLNMRYLPYKWNGKYGDKYTSFGAHYVTLVKLDEKEGFAYMTDTETTGLNKVRITDMMKARGSDEGNLTLIPKFHYYYFKIPVDFKIDHKRYLKKSFQFLIKNADGDGGYLMNLKKFPDDIENIEKDLPSKYILKPLFYSFNGWIELFGTGGSAFRNFYRDYLLETGKNISDKNIIELGESFDISAKKWKELSFEFINISNNVEKYYNKDNNRKQLYKKASVISQDLYNIEFELIEKVKSLEMKQ